MKIIKDGKGKLIFDFEGQEIDVSDVDVESVIEVGAINFCSNLFNGDVISGAINGNWLFSKRPMPPVPLQAPESPVEA